MELKQTLYLLRKLYEEGFGVNEEGFLEVLSEILEDPNAFFHLFDHLFEVYVEDDRVLKLLKDIGALNEMVPAFKSSDSDPQARKDLYLMIRALEEAFQENNLKPLSEDLILFVLTRTDRAIKLGYLAQKSKESGEPVSRPLERLRETFFIDNETLINQFLVTILDNRNLLASLARVFESRYFELHPFLIFLQKEGVLERIVKERAAGRDIDSLIREEIEKYFQKTGNSLDFDQAWKECNQIFVGTITRLALEGYAAGKYTWKEVLGLATQDMKNA